MLKKLILVFLMMNWMASYSQNDSFKMPNASITHYQYPDKEVMELSPNGELWVLKEGIEDGMYIGWYNKNLFKDTAFIGYVINNEMNGRAQWWDKKDKYKVMDCHYLDGMRHGECKYILKMEGQKYMNHYLYDYGVIVKTYREDW